MAPQKMSPQKIRALKKYFLGIGLISILVATNISNAAPFTFGGKAGFEDFQWEEFSENGTKFLTESGTRFAISGFLENTLRTNNGFII